MFDILVFIGVIYAWLGGTITVSVIYLILEIKGNKKTNTLTCKPAFKFLKISTIAEIILIISFIIEGLQGKLDCGYQDVSCAFFNLAALIIIVNTFVKLLILSIFCKIRSKKNNIPMKYNPIIIWFIVVFLIISGVIIRAKIADWNTNKYEYTLNQRNVEIIYLNSISDLPKASNDYEEIDYDLEGSEHYYSNMKEYKNKKVRIYGITYNEIKGNTVVEKFLNSEELTYCFDSSGTFSEIDCTSSTFFVSFNTNNYQKMKSLQENYYLYTVVEGTIYNKYKEGDWEHNDDWEMYYVNINPTKIYIIKDASILKESVIPYSEMY